MPDYARYTSENLPTNHKQTTANAINLLTSPLRVKHFVYQDNMSTHCDFTTHPSSFSIFPAVSPAFLPSQSDRSAQNNASIPHIKENLSWCQICMMFQIDNYFYHFSLIEAAQALVMNVYIYCSLHWSNRASLYKSFTARQYCYTEHIVWQLFSRKYTPKSHHRQLYQFQDVIMVNGIYHKSKNYRQTTCTPITWSIIHFF